MSPVSVVSEFFKVANRKAVIYKQQDSDLGMFKHLLKAVYICIYILHISLMSITQRQIGYQGLLQLCIINQNESKQTNLGTQNVCM